MRGVSSLGQRGEPFEETSDKWRRGHSWAHLVGVIPNTCELDEPPRQALIRSPNHFRVIFVGTTKARHSRAPVAVRDRVAVVRVRRKVVHDALSQ